MSSYSHYRALGVPLDATSEDIKDAYRRESLRLHPDRNAEATATEEFIRVQEAHSVLSDANKRRAYDESIDIEPRSRSHKPLAGDEMWEAMQYCQRVGPYLDVLKCSRTRATELGVDGVQIEAKESPCCAPGRTCGELVCLDEHLKAAGIKRQQVFLCKRHRVIHCCSSGNEPKCATQVACDDLPCSVYAQWLAQCWVKQQQQMGWSP